MLHLGLNEREIERVLAGHQPGGRDDLAEVAFLFARLRTLRDFEQAPPMSPKLLAELDATEVARRDDALARQRARERARRNRTMRRRWQLVGAAAAVTMLGGLFVVDALNAGDGGQAEVDVESPPTSGPGPDQPTSSVADTQPPQTTTTAPPPTAAPTTAAPPPEASASDVHESPSEDGRTVLEIPPQAPPGRPNADGDDWEDDEMQEYQEQWREWCEDNPRHEYCYWFEMFEDQMRGNGPQR
jgi:hypothetical protein